MSPRRRTPKPATVAYTLLAREDHEDLYARLDWLVTEYHEELRDARIALAWCTSWRPDVDGNVTLGRCKRATALDRELHAWDFVILLREQWWTASTTTALQRDALLDHELCHATVKLDPITGDPALDARGRVVYRIRRHDLEEFACIAERWGLWKRDLQLWFKAAKRSKRQPELPLDEAPAEASVH